MKIGVKMYFPSYRMCKKAIEHLMRSFIFFYCSLERELVAGPAGAASRARRASRAIGASLASRASRRLHINLKITNRFSSN